MQQQQQQQKQQPLKQSKNEEKSTFEKSTFEKSTFNKNKFSTQISKNPEVALKLGRLIDKNNPEKALELITRPPVTAAAKAAAPLSEKQPDVDPISEKKKEKNQLDLK